MLPVITTLQVSLLLGVSLPIILLHTLGTTLLLRNYKNSPAEKISQLYIASLSLSEILWTTFKCTEAICLYIKQPHAYKVMASFHMSGVIGVYMASIFYITIDKLMEIILNIKYHVYWDERKAKLLLLATWMGGALCGAATVAVLEFTSYTYVQIDRLFFLFIFPIADFVFVMTMIPTYIFLFRKFRQSRLAPAVVGHSHQQRRLSAWEDFRESSFYTAVLLIASFVFLYVLPDLTYMGYYLSHGHRGELPHELSLVCLISYSVSCLVDAWIYILTQPKIRRKFLRIVLCKRCRRDPCVSEGRKYDL